ncbi:M23 family metallopeptidase [Streptomyces sp. F63]|uniref:M23 family metallopeptidase n=1 Tax=Streptomyces sp. F63 TaxID=2824887 RepID=UPI001B397B22|nr:M23 family metallopeptidase [Streptomyces sp. F63]MBQ0982995.1 M23 family metallopeptidase [Streptomyces sp. F63]
MSLIHALKRARPYYYGLLALLIVLDLLWLDAVREVPWWAIGLVVAFGLTAEFLPARSQRRPRAERREGPEESPAVEVGPPVRGRWRALNSPAGKVPSHGTRVYGQSHAIDLVREAEPGERERPAFGWWPVARRNGDFPAFGEPVRAVADGTVVRVRDGRRDHLGRTSWPALPYFFAEAMVRGCGTPAAVVGNHVVLDLGGGTYALYAHLRRRSVTVREGDRVSAGQRLAATGNSGNSTEPHLHFQLMDRPDPLEARGVPFHWRGIGVPANGEVFTAPEPRRGRGSGAVESASESASAQGPSGPRPAPGP